MTREFWGSSGWRYNRWLWAFAFFLLAARQFLAGRPLSGIMPPLLLTGICLLLAWRRCTAPVYTVTDDELLIGTGLIGKKRIDWREIQDVQQDGYGVRLIGRERFGGTALHLSRLPKAERDEFLELVQTKVGQANADA
ncbi:MAG: hypothetical protein OEU26_18300 [Candidatus Tectomicrobia bacterium]|nr:hypothetical protein [Candidatus Tectomicrobia bacterium]